MNCKHNWQEDEMFSCGAVSVITGTGKELVEGGMNRETRIECSDCGKAEFLPVEKLPSMI